MAIVKLKKLTFCGLLQDKTSILEQLQTLGGLHLIPLVPVSRSEEGGNVQQAEMVTQALKYLNSCPNKRHQLKHDKNFRLEQVADQVLKVKSKIRELSDRYDAIQKRIKELRPWGDFQLPDNGMLASQRLWFYIIPKRMMNKLNDIDYVWQTVYQDNLYCYVVVISENEPPENAFSVPRTHTGSLPLSELESQASELELTLEDLQAQRESYTRWITLMTLHFNETLNADDLKQAQELTRDEVGVFALQGWLPKKEVERYRRFADAQNLALLVEDPAPEDKPPTLLENPPQLAGGEELVGFYQTPSYQGWDPSLMVFFSFTLFFAIILSDAGYAALFMTLLAFKWRKMGSSDKGRRLRALAASTLSMSIVWGMLCGSYFGLAPKAESVLATVKVFDLNNFDSMIRLTVAIGVVHIALANGIKAYQLRRSSQALAPIGWIGLVSGGFCLWLAQSIPNAALKMAGPALMAIGAVLLILFSSARPIARFADLIWRLADGIKSLIGITQLFGDVLSYMRLFALGLASASLALTFNQLAEQVMQGMPGPGLFLGILILLLGHTLNLMLCLMSGLVHGLRLNFIEFYNWSVSDEGYPFKAFSKKGVR
ncbi:MAG: V-type ATP synthase subunit I [Gammaproteobacteria bacterium]